MKNLTFAAAAFALALPAALYSPSALGQAISTNGGSIQGIITDPSGAAVPGATVTIAAPSTGYSKILTTDAAGYYALGPLVPGSYVITVDAASFQRLRVNTVVQTGTVTSGSEKLTVGSQSETVEVNAGAIQINTDQIGVSGIVTQEQIDSLPVNGRNILDIAQIQPGVILQQGQSFDPTKAGYSAISVSGVSGRTTRILLDGQDITDETVGTTIFNVPSGPIDELQLNRSTQDVSGEVTSTGQVLVSTHSGTNQFHGNAFYNFQDYRAGFANASPLTGSIAPFQRNQFGGYVGGPLIKDKLFFFGGGERIKQDQRDASNGDPTFAALYSQYPLVPEPFRDNYSTARLDYNGPHGIRFFVRGSYSTNADAATFGYAPYSVYNNRDNVPAIVGGADFATGKVTHSFRVGYEKFHNILGDETGALGTSIYNPSNIVGFPLAINGSFEGDNFDAGPNFLAPQQTYQSDKQFRYDGTWTVGAHTLKFGYNQNRILNGGFAEFFGAALFATFSSSANNLAPGCAPGQLPCSIDPLNGYTAAAYYIGNGNSLFSERPGFGLTGGGDPSWRFGAYVGDTWKVSPTFTLSAGLRWSVDTDRANQDLPTPLCSSVTASYNPGCSGDTPLFDQYQLGLGKQTHQPYADFGPQLGFVYSPGGHKTSLRGGIGIYYDSSIFNNTGNARTEVIQSNGAFQNQGVLGKGASRVNLPGLGAVTAFNATTGAPCASATAAGCVAVGTVSTESIAQAAPQINALKTYYQSKVQGSTGPNPVYIGTGDELYADNIYAAPYVVPYSIQFNGGFQQEIRRGLIISADYVHNATLKLPLSVDVNHDGAASTLNKTAAQNAIASTLAACGVASVSQAIAACPGLHPAMNGNPPGPATIGDFAGNGLDSGSAYLGGTSAGANGLTPNTGAAFAGINPNVGEGLFILPEGRSGYDALQLVLQQQTSHPLPGITRSNLQISYSLSRIVSTNAAGNSADQSFEGAHSFNNNNPTEFIGRNNLDHLNELNMGGSLGIKYGIQVGFIGHFYSSPATTLTLDNLAGNIGQIFTTDVFGDGGPSNSGVAGGLAPGQNPGSYMRGLKPANLNQYINNYNATYANTATPAGQALINAGLLTLGQLQALGGVQQPLAAAPASPLRNAAFRTFDLNASYPLTFKRFREGLSLVPGVAMYNVFNMSNFTAFSSGVLLNQADANTPGFVNGPADQFTLNSNRVLRGAGTFDQGGPRTTEFQLKLNF